MRTIHRELVDDSTEKLLRVRSLKGGEERKNVVVVVVGLFNCRKYLLEARKHRFSSRMGGL
jgi:hypothetical protein